MNKKKSDLKIDKIINILLVIGLVAFVASVFYINLNANYGYYSGDMYCDIDYARQAWNSKTIFPEGWVFGNQYFVVATPVLAALFYGIVGNGVTAMGLASSVMTILILLTYLWMLKPYASFKARACGILCIVCASAAVLNPLTNYVGWQMFFTMASYYSCYLIVAMLTFGCYVRLREGKKGFALFILCLMSVVLSFATGMQSIRQTEVMVLPLLVTETAFFIHDKLKKNQANIKTILFTIFITVSNISGCILIRKIKPDNHEIYGNLAFADELGIHTIYKKLIGLIGFVFPKPYLSAVAVLSFLLISAVAVFGFLSMLKSSCKDKRISASFCIALLIIIGLGGVIFLLLFSSITIRNTYLFMFYPLGAIFITNLLNNSKKNFLIVTMLVCIALAFGVKIIPVAVNCSKDMDDTADFGEIAEYLCENDYGVVVAQFDYGAKIGIASDEELKVGSYENAFEEKDAFIVDYLCNPIIFDGEEKTAYIFNEQNMDTAEFLAKKNNAVLKEVKTIKGTYCWYIFESSSPLY